MKTRTPARALGPKAHYVRNAILQMLRQQGLKAGDKIAAERELASELGINHQTVRRALAELVVDGVVEKRPRSGNFVRNVERFTPLAVAFPPYLLKKPWHQASASLIFDGINDVLDHGRYSLTMLSYRYEYFLEDVARFVEARRIRGLFLVGASQVRSEDVKRIMDQGVKVVLLTNHQQLAALGISSFYYDPLMVLSQLIAGLVERGHRRIGVVRYSLSPNPDLVFRLGQVCEQYGLGDPEDISIVIPNESNPPDYSPLEKIFSSKPAFTALVAPDEVIARKIFQESYKRKLFVPDDFSLAAYSDNTPDSHPVPLTAPETPVWHRKIVTMAAEHLINALEGTPVEGIQMPIGGGLIWRESVATPKT